MSGTDTNGAAGAAAGAGGSADAGPAIPPGYKVLQEGQAKILQKGNEVFYNEAQVTNRDLSIAALRLFLRKREGEIKSGALKKGGRKERAAAAAAAAAAAGGEEKAAEAPKAEGAEAAAAAGDAAGAGDKPSGGDKGEGSAPEKGAAGGGKGEGGKGGGGKGGGGKGGGGKGGGGKGGGGKGGGGKGGAPASPRLLEGLAASGLRSIRYALEVPELGSIDANDLDPGAAAAMRRNIALNGGAAAAKIRTLCSDARLTMMQNPGAYDVVDLDPYGTPASLLDTAIQAVSEGGLLMVTATDMANLCGNNSTNCWSNYGCYPVHRPYCHEMALRIVLACLETHAARYKRRIVPLLSLSVDFYVRLFVRVYTAPNEVKEAPQRLSYLWQSSGCDAFWLQPVGQCKAQGNSKKFMPGAGPGVPSERCPETGSGYIMGGPIWNGPLHDADFAREVLEEIDSKGTKVYAQAVKIRGYLLSVVAELPDAPLYYNLHDMCKAVRATAPKTDQFRSALVNAGYRVSGSHCCPLAIKTDAPPGVVWDVVRCWVRRSGPSAAAMKDPDSYAARLLAKEPTLEANFSVVASAMARTKQDKAPRFVHNPAYWGPKARHGRPDQTRPQAEGDGSAAGPSGRGGGGGGGGRGRGGKGKNRGGRGRGASGDGGAAAEGEAEAKPAAEGAEGAGAMETDGGAPAGEAAAAAPEAAGGDAAGGAQAGGGEGAAAAGGDGEPPSKRQKA
ncbi:hypothetical protein HYH03_014226 [Edaphochlamys debaryana]|uniref:tRNA (guanine(26)-N(2))-dimethyltransferase n=1 Tax=Edaphochlamys debaryana TaxID=47281 RepID=A0A835XN41_9CHLO|nr:hypothetical protein HYH03_014226 [Edaphochlamys debaryana]|eukprot:KAG2487113.1 hypothetical protein HYH03_014226 [Edaphochlamys debaryana]